MPPKIPIKKAFAHHVERLGDRLVDVEHYRFSDEWVVCCGVCYRTWPGYRAPLVCRVCNYRDTLLKDNAGYDGFDHYAVAVCRNGAHNEIFFGSALCCYLDQYNRKLGHAISVGRALSNAIKNPCQGLQIPASLAGVALRDHCRQRVEIQFHVTLPKVQRKDGSDTHKTDPAGRDSAQAMS